MTEANPHEWPSHLQHEIIDVAAVAVAMFEDLQFGHTRWRDRPFDVEPDDGHNDERYNQFEYVAHAVQERRKEQDNKWGSQHHSIEKWLAILMEEVGEVARAALDDVIFVGAAVGEDTP